MYTDTISDLLTRIRNGLRASHQEVRVPHSNIKEGITGVLKQYGFIDDYKVTENNKKKVITISLNEKRKDLTLKRISKPGQRLFTASKDLKPIKSGLGIRIISTHKGVMSNVEASKLRLGGEIICEIY
ncbi:30S ribosomal protein S8 [Candidatus Peregrinibacteria bacterium]|nr:30S ribosomal protein S8 [Candidatus Peregrinibacteria bacterium]